MNKNRPIIVLFIAAVLCLTGCTSDSTPKDTAPLELSSAEADSLTICSLNVQFLGHFKKKDDSALAGILKGYDIVVIQELVAPPVAGTYPDDTSLFLSTSLMVYFHSR